VPQPPAGFAVSFLDVGQGDATLLQDGAAAVLVDTGPPDGPILDRLRSAGVRRLDLLVLTHAQADHEGAAARILRRLPVGAVLDGGTTAPPEPGVPREAGRAIAASRVRRIVPAAGQTLRVGRLELRVLWPPPTPPVPGTDPNERAVVLHVRDGAVDVLLTADAESPVTLRLPLAPVDVLKVAHHGSADPGLPLLLERLRPRVAAIEVGGHNTYGHPDPGTLAILERAVPRVVRTDEDGTIRLTEADGRLAISTGR
jgi:competence protein ComEC